MEEKLVENEFNEKVIVLILKSLINDWRNLKIKKMKYNLKISVIGLGYVGTPLALSLGRYFKVVGFDLDKNRIKQLKNKIDITNETNFIEFTKAKENYFFR